MSLCLIMDNPETSRHPVIAVALQVLSIRHSVRLLDVRELTGAEAIAREREHQPADLYLLKSHASQALDLAQDLEQHGKLVVNNWSASSACRDRWRMTELMLAANLPWPQTRHFASLAEAVRVSSSLTANSWPLIMKSRYSHRGDLVEKLEHPSQLQALLANWEQEPVVFQEFVPGDGWDIKLWVIDQQVFAARRRTPLETDVSKQDFPIAANDLPHEWKELALAIGQVFRMPLYGVDLIITANGPLIVDVNAFPGFRGVPGASEALVYLVDHLLAKGAEKV